VLLDIVHNLLEIKFVEIPFELDWTADEVKDKVYKLTGSRVEHMTVSVDGRPMIEGRKLKDFRPRNRTLLTVQDNDPHSQLKGGAFDNVNLVKKFELTDDQYDQRDNTYRSYKKKMLAENPNWIPVHVQRKPEKGASGPDEVEESPDTTKTRVKVGARCQVNPGARRGQVLYVGLVPELPPRKKSRESEIKISESNSNPLSVVVGAASKPESKSETDADTSKRTSTKTNEPKSESKQRSAGAVDEMWIGVKFDDPVGKGDGTVKSKRYFKAEPKFGGFVNPIHVEVGDFPERDVLDEDEDVEEEL